MGRKSLDIETQTGSSITGGLDTSHLTSEERMQGILFRGSRYPLNFFFYPLAYGDNLSHGQIIGEARAYLKNDDDQLLIWDNNAEYVISMSQETYDKRKQGAGTVLR